MASGVSFDGKVKLLDTARPNTIPKFFTDGSDRYDSTKADPGAPTAMQIRSMLSASQKAGDDPLADRPDMVAKLEAARIAQVQDRREREKSLFLLDREPLDTFALPGKPETSAMLPAKKKALEQKTKKTKLKVTEISKEDPGPGAALEKEEAAYNEFSFLATATGYGARAEGDEERKEGSMRRSQTAPAKTGKTGGTGQTADLDEASVILSGLQTGDDAINFFARFGGETGVKFVHLQEAKDGKEYSPYDLVRIDGPVPVAEEYYTMSPAGIVQNCPGENSETTQLSAWMRHGMLFKILRNIGFYKYFLHRKIFNTWRDNVRFLLFAKQRQNVGSRLYMTRKTTTSAILSIKKHLMNVQSVRLLYLDGRTMEKDSFVEQQTQNCIKSGALFEEAMRNVTSEVQTVIHQIQNMHSRASVDPNNTAEAYNDDMPEKHKSLLKLRQEKIERIAMRKQAKLEYATLPDFIRFIDYLTVEALVSIAITTLQSFYDEFVKSRKNGIFETMIRFNSNGSYFSPTCGELTSVLDRLIETMVNAVGNLNRVAYLNSKSQTSGASIQSIVRNDRKFCQTIEDIKRRLEQDFERAEEHAHSYDSVRPIYDFNNTWDLAAFRAETHDMGTFKSMMQMINDWNKELEKLRNRPIGVLEIDSKKLKNELTPLREARLSEIKSFIMENARAKCLALTDTYKEYVTKLQNKPTQLKDFAGQSAVLAGMRDEEKSLFKQAFSVDQMYALLQQSDVPIPPEDSVLHEDLHDKQQMYRNEMETATKYKESKVAEMASNVESNIIKLEDQITGVVARLDDNDFTEATRFNDAGTIVEELDAMQAKLTSFEQVASTYTDYQSLFGSQPHEFNNLSAGRERNDAIRVVWQQIHSFNEKFKSFTTDQFTDLNVEEMDREVQVLFKDAYALHKKVGTSATELLKDKVSELKAIMPAVMDLGNPNIKARHWEKIFNLVGKDYIDGMEFSLDMLLKGKIMDHKDAIGDISGVASGESQLTMSLEKIVGAWEGQTFIVMNHRDQHNLYVLGSLEDIFMLLEDNQVTLQTMLGSRFIKIIQDEVELWSKKLANFSETLDEWLVCQKAWMYLENIFGAEDIQKQLPAESQKFLVVDRSWKQIMTKTFKNPLCLASMEEPEGEGTLSLLDQFNLNNTALDSIQKSLEEYLETKRMAFPRFYFLSNDELLEILSQTRDPHAVQPHMVKCFDAIKRIKFGEGSKKKADILGFFDPGGEYVELSEEVKAQGPVENWLLAFEKGMRGALYDKAKHAFTKYPATDEGAIDRSEWLWSYPAQVVIAIDQTMWTSAGEMALARIAGTYEDEPANPAAMADFLEFSLKQIDAMVELVRQPLDKQQRTLLGALLTIDVHARDVTRALNKEMIGSRNDFMWTKQLRYVWDEKLDDVVAKQTIASFQYGYEYLGNGPRLVITPLTDLCYMTLTGALHMRLGGAPAGPAGTGKTETTKDLAKALANFCVVFNCSDGLDYKIMGRFFSGLAQQGAWSCFDEFNRIDIEVLSVIAQQILCIQQAISRGLKEFDFEGLMIPLNYSFGVFITMNPGYAGRTELPDNLKSLFRPVAMMVPDYRLIAEIMLFSEGFANALPLSNKMSQLYALASEQLSKQSHYDFGMRAVKTVLVAAGQLKRKEPDTFEDLLLIRAMRDSNVPKFLEQDIPLFSGILKDLFPGVQVPYVDYGKLQECIETALLNNNLQKVPSFISKVIQVHETQLVRHGMMIVGESGSGKSCNHKILAEALTMLHDEGIEDKDGFYKQVDRLILNPKSIAAGELYGEFNLATNEWRDGIVPKLVRGCVDQLNEGSDNRKWIIFDGPVDAVWIENMNTVLDDNKMLCLANSERIKLPHTMHMLFEVQDLKVASPATVSRCGMVYMEQVHVGVLSLVRTWAGTTLKELTGLRNANKMLAFIEAHLEATIDFLRYECKEKVPTSNNQVTAELTNLVAAMLIKENVGFDEGEGPSKTLAEDMDLMYALVVWATIWSAGANIVDADREKFAGFVTGRFKPLMIPKFALLLSEGPYDMYLDLKKKEVRSWQSLLPEFRYDTNQPYFNILVPTVETTKYRYVLDRLMNSGCNVLFMAETGVGKSVVMSSFLNDMVAEGSTVSYVMGYSAQTKPANLRDVLESKLEKKRKTLLGPPSGKKMFLFVDDLNMPALETYGAQPPNELLRQIIDQGGYYDTNKLFFKNVQDVVVCSAAAPPGGGRNEVSPRLLRHFHMVWLTNLSVKAMHTIFTAIVRGYMNIKLGSFVDLAEPMVHASVEIYMRIQQELLPTPSKSHYTFNLRDLSKVFQGLLMVQPKHLTTREGIIKLWAHEASRVFRDRLISEEDRTWFNDAVTQQLHHGLNEPNWTNDDFADIIFGDFMTKENKEYQELEDRDKVLTTLNEYLEEYNITFPSRMDLVFFRDAINHITRIARVLSQPRGNALLVGVGGSGRQSLARMSGFMADFKVRQIEITRGYGMNEWHENLKEILMMAGAKNQPTVFLFSDTQIVTETFLEDLNNILNSGEVPNLFAADEMDKIIGMVRPLAKKAGVETRDGIMQHYVSLVRENLHVILCMSPIGANFRTRCRMFPSLVNCCTIDWFNAWPEDALFSVAHRLFESQTSLGIGPYVDSLSTMCNKMHRTVEIETVNFFNEVKRYNYTTPTSYLELIKLYVDTLKTQQEKISNNERRYRVGLDKLRETEEVVAKLEAELTEMKPILEQASIDTEKLLISVTADQKDADEQAAIVQVDVEAANKVAASVQTIKDDCQADLDEAMPAYEAAMKALQTLDKKSIQEMKSFANPPEMVKFTLEAVAILFGVEKKAIEKDSWGESKKLLNMSDFLDQCKNYDKDNIKKKIMKQIMTYFKDERFVPENVKSQSSAAMCLCSWVRAMVIYDKVAKGIEPKKAALKSAEDSLSVTMSELKVKKDQLQVVLDRVAALQKQLKDTQDKKAELEAQANKAKVQLVRAGQLLGGLGGEKIRWQQSALQLNAALTNLVGDMCLAAGCMAYLGPFTSQFRARIVNSWIVSCKELGIPCGEFSLLTALAEPVVVRGWQIDGLPADDFSCENGLLTTMGRRWPLMIDPQGQANRWVRNMYSNNNLQIIKLTEKEFLRTLENGIRYGAPVLLENVGQELDPSLEPVLLKQVFKKAGQMLLRLGDTDVPYSDEFKFMITTKLANPHYMPEVCIKVTVINFTVTMKGLEDQLLVDVIKNERPDLEERKDKLVVSIANDQKQLLDIEEQILSMLANASGNILDDEDLINALALSKTTSTAINTRLVEAETTTLEINTTREGYRSVATRGSVIYFVVANLALVDPMYQYSLQFYKALVETRLQKTEKKDVLQERLDLLIDDITSSIYLNVCRGLFEKDKLVFAFIMAANIDIQSKAVSAEEFLMFMVGAIPDATTLEANPFPEDAIGAFEIDQKAWQNAVMLEASMKVFAGLPDALKANPKEWADFQTTENPHSDPLPGGWEERLNRFQRLLIVRVLREEKITSAIRRYIGENIGQFFCSSPPFDLEGSYNDSTSTSPLIFILSPGADPTDYLVNLAEKQGKGGGGLRIISLGQGQGPIAERAVDQAQKMGDWVCLQNCHLAVSWLSKLESIVETMQNDSGSVNPSFRLWLTSMPSEKFPVPVLQNGLKVTNEPPKGLKANLGRTFADISDGDYESCSKPRAYKKLVFATAFFNALILERRKFGAVGWNIAYEWMLSDLKAAMRQVKMYTEEADDGVPWETLNVSVCAVTYGGRVTDMWDKRTVASILVAYFHDGLMSDDFRFSSGGEYYAPQEGTLEETREYIRNLPSEDRPDVFGLHANAAITFQQKESRALLDTVVTCAGEGSGGGGDSNLDSKVAEIAVRISDRMPGQYDLRKAHPDSFKKQGDTDAVNSLGVFLGQELLRFNELIVVMAASLHQLQRAIKGEVVMDGVLENMYSCFVFQKVPPAWENAGYPCLKPLPSWVEDFVGRIDFMGKWLHDGPRPAYWLSGFFFPQGFMTAVKQTYSRTHAIAVDTLRIASEMTGLEAHDVTEAPENGAYIYGLFMEGGRFCREKMQMAESQPRQLLDDLPAIRLVPVISADYDPKDVYSCPLYKTSIRAGTLSTTGHSTNFVVTMTVPSTTPEDHWVRRGCAMLCMRDD